MGSATILLGLAVIAASDLEDGIELYQNKDYREALAAFGRAGAKKQSAPRRAKIHVYIGIIQYRFGQKDDARASFETAFDHYAEVSFPDASQVGARRMFERMRPVEEAPDKPVKKKKKKKRKKRRKRRVRPDDGPPGQPLASLPSPTPAPDVPPPATAPPPPIVAPVAPPLEPGPPVAAWATAGGGAIAAVVGTVLVVVGRNNGQAALDPGLDAVEAESLHDRHRVQVGSGIGALAVAGVCAGVSAYLFATH